MEMLNDKIWSECNHVFEFPQVLTPFFTLPFSQQQVRLSVTSSCYLKPKNKLLFS